MKRTVGIVVGGLAIVWGAQEAVGNPLSFASNEFPIVMLAADSRGDAKARLAAMGVTYVHTYVMGTSTNQADLDDDLLYFDDATNNGLKVMAELRGLDRAGETNGLEKMEIVADAFKDHPGLGFWYLYDEPTNHTEMPGILEPFYQMLTNKEPKVSVAICHAWNNTCELYTNVQDMVMPDYYSVRDQPFPDAPVNDSTACTQYALTSTGQPVIPMLQCCIRPNGGGTHRFPVIAELRYWSYSSLVMGVRGLSWYSYWRAYDGAGNWDWMDNTFAPMIHNVRQFVDTVAPAHDPDPIRSVGGSSDEYLFLAVWERNWEEWVVLVNNRNYSRTETISMEDRISSADLLPLPGTRDVTAQIVSGSLQSIPLNPWETFVWIAVPLGLRYPPTNVQATAKSAGRIDLMWTCVASGETGFKIDRQAAGETNWSRIGTAPANATTYRDNTGPAPNSLYAYRIKAYKGGDGNGPYSDEISATTLGGIDLRPKAGDDDAEQNAATGLMLLVSQDLDLIQSGPADQVVGIRFPDVPIPHGATIGEAHIQFTVANTSSAPTSLTLRGQAIDNAPAFSTNAYNISTRDVTAASTAWNNVPAWLSVGGTGPNRLTPDLSGILQEIVDRPGWTVSNALAIIITGNGDRSTVSYDNNPTNAPYMHVYYSVPKNFVAYNDLAWFDGQLTNRITRFTTIENFPEGDCQGRLVDYETGDTLAVSVSVKGGGIPYEGQGLHPGPKTDASTVFEGKVDGDSAISYDDNDLVLTLTGLDPRKRYEFVLYGDRNNSGYTNRFQVATLSGADGFVNASTPGTTILADAVPNDTTKYNAGYNNTNGYVTRFANIDPGADGTIMVTVARSSGLSYYTYANAFMLAGSDPVKVAKGATWKYRKGTAEASDPPTAWRMPAFDDTAWLNGATPMGYGDGPYATSLGDMYGGYRSVFLRIPFSVEQPVRVSRVALWSRYDDGFIAWINGVEVGRTNVPGVAGTFLAHDTKASTSIEPAQCVLALEGARIPSLVAGTNILAVQVFNQSITSSDMTLDCRLTVAEDARVLQDADGDGMSDPWETDAFGGASVSNAAANQDFDLDGNLNIEEYIAGTNPDDVTDLFQLTVDTLDGKVVVGLDGVEATDPAYQGLNRFYAIERRSALGDAWGLWEFVTGCEAIPATTPSITTTNVASNGVTFYRGRVWLESE